MGLGYTTTYTKITTFVTAAFTLAVGIGIGLLCYYWVWLGMPDKTRSAKIWIMVGFTFYGILALLFGGIGVPYVWYIDESDRGDTKGNVGMAIALLLLCGVVPGIMLIVDICIISHRNRVDAERWGQYNSGTATAPAPKRKAPEYDANNDPAIIKNAGTSGGQGGKKKLVFKNPDSSGTKPAATQGGKKKLVFNSGSKDESSTGKKKLVFKPKNK